MAILIEIDKTVTLPKNAKKKVCTGKELSLTQAKRACDPARYPLHHECHVGGIVKT